MKKHHLIASGLGTAALLLAGAAVSAPPPGLTFNNWAAFEGRVILNPNANDLAAVVDDEDFSVVGSDCTPPACVILLQESGMLQARVRGNDDPLGQGYFQTITIEEGFTGLAMDATFRNESFVESSSNVNNFPVAAENYVQFDDNDFMRTRINNGNLRDVANNEAAFEIYQKNTLEGFGNVDFWFERQSFGGAQFNTNTTAGSMMRIDYTVDNITGNRGTPMTMRQTSGFYTQGNGVMELADAQSIAYSEGDHLSMVFGAGLLWHGGEMHTGGSAANRHFEVQSIRNVTTAEAANWTNASNSSTIDDTGVGYVSFTAVWADAYTVNENLWDDNFGTAPNADSVSGTFTNLQNDPFPDAPWND